MAVLVSDSFNRADSTTILGTTDSLNGGGTAKTWVPLTGVWGISGNRAYVTAGSNQIAYVDAGMADVNFTVNINSASANYTSLALRIQDASNFILIQISGLTGNASTVEIHKRIAGTYTKLAGSSVYVSADSDIVKVTMQGTAITVYINGIQLVTATATEYQTLTKHGFLAGPAGRFDNLIIEDLAATGILTGSATLQGVGTLSASGTMTQTGSASLQGVGTLSASGTVIVSGSANLQGVGTLSASGTLIVSGSASLQGVGTLSASGSGTSPNPTGSASLQGVGTLVASGVMTITGGASLRGVGTLQASGGYPISGSASLMGVGTLTASGLNIKPVEILRTVNLQGDCINAIELQGEFTTSVSLLGEMINKVVLEGEI